MESYTALPHITDSHGKLRSLRKEFSRPGKLWKMTVVVEFAVPVPPSYVWQLNWLSICQRVTYKIVIITYKTRRTGTPAYLSHLIRD